MLFILAVDLWQNFLCELKILGVVNVNSFNGIYNGYVWIPGNIGGQMVEEFLNAFDEFVKTL